MERTSRSSTPESSEPEIMSRKAKFAAIFKNITIEPMMLAHMIGMSSSSIVVQNLYIDRICRINHGLDPDICKDLPEHTDYGKL